MEGVCLFVLGGEGVVINYSLQVLKTLMGKMHQFCKITNFSDIHILILISETPCSELHTWGMTHDLAITNRAASSFHSDVHEDVNKGGAREGGRRKGPFSDKYSFLMKANLSSSDMLDQQQTSNTKIPPPLFNKEAGWYHPFRKKKKKPDLTN